MTFHEPENQPARDPEQLTSYERTLILTKLNPMHPDERLIGQKLATTEAWLERFDGKAQKS